MTAPLFLIVLAAMNAGFATIPGLRSSIRFISVFAGAFSFGVAIILSVRS